VVRKEMKLNHDVGLRFQLDDQTKTDEKLNGLAIAGSQVLSTD